MGSLLQKSKYIRWLIVGGVCVLPLVLYWAGFVHFALFAISALTAWFVVMLLRLQRRLEKTDVKVGVIHLRLTRDWPYSVDSKASGPKDLSPIIAELRALRRDINLLKQDEVESVRQYADVMGEVYHELSSKLDAVLVQISQNGTASNRS